MFPRWLMTAFSSIMLVLIVTSILLTRLANLSFLLASKSVTNGMISKVLDTKKPEDQTPIDQKKGFKGLQKPSELYLTIEQYLNRLCALGKDLKPVPLSSNLDNSTVVLLIGDAHVPSVVHYIYFKAPGFRFGFAGYVAFLSVYKYIRPGLTIIWGDELPDKTTNGWWARTLKEFPNIYHVFTEPVTTISGAEVKFVQHKSDWLRIHILLDHGGIYLDHDVFVVRPFTDLLKYRLTMGRETPESVSPGIILSAPNQEFFRKWRSYYKQYKPNEFNMNSNRVLNNLANSATQEEVHILNGSFTDPYPTPHRHRYALYCANFDVSHNYAVHMYRPADFAYAIPANERQLAGYNCTLGNVMRTVLYDDPKVKAEWLADGCATHKNGSRSHRNDVTGKAN